MWKKIVLSGLFVAFATVLIAGALNRTASRSAQVSGAQLGQTMQDGAERGERNGADSIRSNAGATGQVNVTEWQTATGTVSNTDASRLEITLNDGSLIEVGGRAWQLAAAQNFAANPGDSLTLRGFDENGVFQVGQIDTQNTGQILRLRDATGRPLWAGRGRG